MYNSKRIIDFITRNFVWFALGVVALLLLGFARETLNTILLVCVYEAVAIALSGVALWVYTNIRFTNELSQGTDGVMSIKERADFQRVIAAVFIGVHILVAVVVLGNQFIETDKAYSEREKLESKKIEITIDTTRLKTMTTIPEIPDKVK